MKFVVRSYLFAQATYLFPFLFQFLKHCLYFTYNTGCEVFRYRFMLARHIMHLLYHLEKALSRRKPDCRMKRNNYTRMGIISDSVQCSEVTGSAMIALDFCSLIRDV